MYRRFDLWRKMVSVGEAATALAITGVSVSAESQDICGSLKDKFPFAGRMTSMSDLESSCGVAGDSALGINQLYISYNRQHLGFTEEMCLIEILTESADGSWEVAEGHLESHHYPHGIEQTFTSERFVCRAFICFDALNTPVIHVMVTADETLPIRISAKGFVPAREGASGEYLFDPKMGALIIKRTERRTDERDPRPTFDVLVAIKSAFTPEIVALSETQPTLEASGHNRFFAPLVYFRITSPIFTVGRDSPLATSIAIVVSARNHDFKPWAAAQFEEVKPNLTDAESAARRRWNKTFATAPHLDREFARFQDLYYHCIYVLKRSLHHQGGRFGPNCASFPCKDNYDAHWLWDGAFHAVAFAEFDAPSAKGCLILTVKNQTSDGRFPHFIAYDWIRPGPGSQPPVVAWATWKVYKRTGDKELLKRLYLPLVRNTNWWRLNRDEDGDGLLAWFEPVESGWDNSPRWDSEFGHLESCDLNAYLLVQMKILSDIASEIGKRNEAAEWRAKADELGKRIVEKLYFPEDNLFHEITADTHQPVDILTPAAFMPLWAEAPLPREKASEMIRRYLLDEKHFFGEVPFPVVAYSDAKYQPREYWRGPTRINIAYFMIETLYKYGFHDEAEEAVRRLLEVGSRSPYLHEYYDSQTGEGLGALEYGWTAAFFIEMMLGRYREL